MFLGFLFSPAWVVSPEAKAAEPLSPAAARTAGTVAELVRWEPLPGAAVRVLGRDTPGDGGGGWFRFSDEGEETDGGTHFACTADGVAETAVFSAGEVLNGTASLGTDVVFGSVTMEVAGLTVPDLFLHGHRMNTGGRKTRPRLNHQTGAVDGSGIGLPSLTASEPVTFRFLRAVQPRRWVRVMEGPALNLRWFWTGGAEDAATGMGGNWLAWTLNAAARLGKSEVDLAGGTVRYYGPIEIPDGLTLANGVLKVRDGAGPDNVLKYLRTDYVPEACGLFGLHTGPGLFVQDQARSCGLRNLELDGNFTSHAHCLTHQAEYPGDGGTENVLQNTPTYIGFGASNHGGRAVAPELRLHLENVHIHDFGSCGVLGHARAWFTGNNVRLGSCARNHHFYDANGQWNGLEFYGYAWAAMWKTRHGQYNNVRFVNITDNPWLPGSAQTLMNFDGLYWGKERGTGEEEGQNGVQITHLSIDLGGMTRLRPLFQGVGDALSVSGLTVTGSTAAPAALFSYLGNGYEQGIVQGWSFRDVTLIQRGQELALGASPAFSHNLLIDHVTVKNANGYNDPEKEGQGVIMTLQSKTREDPASRLPQFISIRHYSRRHLPVPPDGTRVFAYDCLDDTAGPVKVHVADSEIPASSSAIIQNKPGTGTVAGLTLPRPERLEILWENSLIPDNAENDHWENFELYMACSKFKNCRTPQGFVTEEAGTLNRTLSLPPDASAGKVATMDIPTRLLWVPRNAACVRLTPRDAATAGLLDKTWITFHHRQQDEEVSWNDFSPRHDRERGDLRACRIRLHFPAPLPAGTVLRLDWTASVSPLP